MCLSVVESNVNFSKLGCVTECRDLFIARYFKPMLDMMVTKDIAQSVKLQLFIKRATFRDIDSFGRF